MRAAMRDLVAPAPKLRVEIVDVREGTRGKEGVPQILNLPLDLPFLVRAAGRTRAGSEVIVPGQLQQPRMKPNCGARPLEDRAAQIVVNQGPRDARPGFEGVDMPAEKTLECLVDREKRKDGARVRQHHHEAGEGTYAAADPNRAET